MPLDPLAPVAGRPGSAKHPAARARLVVGSVAVTSGLVLVGGFAIASPHESAATDEPTAPAAPAAGPSSTQAPSSSTTTPGRNGRSLGGGARPAPSTSPSTTAPTSPSSPPTTTAPRPRARSHAS
jgi:hypothetical protein